LCLCYGVEMWAVRWHRADLGCWATRENFLIYVKSVTHVSSCVQKLCTYFRQYTALLFYIILLSEQQCAAGNIITNSTVYCLMNVCSCFVMVLKLYIFSAVTHSTWRWGVVMVWRMATLPMSCYRVSKITTRSVPQSCTGYLSTSQSLVALWCYVSTEFPFCSSSNLC